MAAGNTESCRRSRPRISASGPALATVFVGKEKERFVVHGSVLTHHSGFFRAALTGNFREAAERTVTLKEEDTSIFEIFVHWLYYQDFPNEDQNDDEGIVDKFYADDVITQIVELYVFGNKYDVADLCRDTIDLCFYLLNDNDSSAEPDVVSYIFEHLPPTNPMCRLLADAPSLFQRPENTDCGRFTNVALLQAIWKRHIELWDLCNELAQLKLCDYHDHATNAARKACERERGEEGDGDDYDDDSFESVYD